MNKTISSSVRECLQLFQKLLSMETLARDAFPHSTFTSLMDEGTQFKLWSGNIGAHKTGASSLDHRLRDASHIRTHVLELLKDLNSMISDVMDIITGDNESRDQLIEDEIPPGEALLHDYDDDDDEPSDHLIETEVEQIVIDINDVINCLLRLSVSIRNPAPHDRFIASAPTDTSHFEKFDIHHVRSKFGGASGTLTERLGRAISRRRQYFKYREMHHQKLSQDLDFNKYDGTASTIASSIPNYMKDSNSSSVMEVVDESNNSDTGVSATSFASSQHVFRDLRPYLCLSSDCPTPEREFMTRRAWIQHEMQNHWKAYHRAYGCDIRFTSPLEYKQHLCSFHANEVPASHLDAVVSLGARPRSKEDGIACFLCGETLVSFRQYRRHAGRHQEQLALFALPSLYYDETDDAVSLFSDPKVSDDSDAGSERITPADLPTQLSFPSRYFPSPPAFLSPQSPSFSYPPLPFSPPLPPSSSSPVSPPPPASPSPPTFDLAGFASELEAVKDRNSTAYWTVSEAEGFPQLLRSFGTDRASIATHMGTKTPDMVKNYFVQQSRDGGTTLAALALEAIAKRERGEQLPEPPQNIFRGQ
ncbi:hypothetical protein PT974_08022 [Cladobotryum mycophilum]|uniref:C2H2-type domain-containing protein n=1 Tax=Cladobotryum mycophilum TaxID=491253 RepID=A0ABR0SD48_9HYPO